MQALINNGLFGILISILGYEVGMFIFKKTKIVVFNPLLIGIIFVILVLVFGHISYNTYNSSAKFINDMLEPATVVLAVPLYKQIKLLKKYLWPVILGLLCGCLVSMSFVSVLCYLFGFNAKLIASLIPKSVTTPISYAISSNLGGITSITVVCVIITGITGAIVGPTIFKLFKIKHPVAMGIAFGTASHSLGTATAFEMGEIQGAMSSLSIGLAGIITVILSTPIYMLVLKIFKLS